MPSHQRARGQEAIVYRSKVVTDDRGNEVKTVDMGSHLMTSSVSRSRSRRSVPMSGSRIRPSTSLSRSR